MDAIRGVPKFMDGVIEVRQLNDTRLLWRTEIGGVDESWRPRSPSRFPTCGSPGTA
jgi:hypothetical protein